MKKAKIEIVTTIEGETITEKYICNYNESIIEYKDKQKTTTTITYSESEASLERSGFVNYRLKHDGSSYIESDFQTLVEGQPFSMVLKIQNKYYNVSKCGKILSIEIHFLREDNCLVKQEFKVEAK